MTHTVFRKITPGRQPEGHWEVNRPICAALQNGATAENCLFTDIAADKSYNVVTIDGSSSMRNCTVVRCTLGDTFPDYCLNYDGVKWLTAYAMPVYCDSVNTKLVNCVFAGVSNTNGVALPPVSVTNDAGQALLKLSHCLMDAMPSNISAESLAAAGNIVVDPANVDSLFKKYARGDWTKGDYVPKAGVGHFIHTYKCDGNPIPSFEGEPEEVALPSHAPDFARLVWDNLNWDNKVSLFVRSVPLGGGEPTQIIINKNN